MPATPVAGLSTAQTLGSAAINLAIVLALIWALAWVLRRVRGLRNNAPGQLHVKASLSLGMKDRVVLIDAAGEYLLLGVSPAGITCLHHYASAPADAPAPAESPFSTLLRRVTHVKGSDNDA